MGFGSSPSVQGAERRRTISSGSGTSRSRQLPATMHSRARSIPFGLPAFDHSPPLQSRGSKRRRLCSAISPCTICTPEWRAHDRGRPGPISSNPNPGLRHSLSGTRNHLARPPARGNGTMPKRSSTAKSKSPKREGMPHDFPVARRVVEQAIGERLGGEPLDDPHAGKNPAAVALASCPRVRVLASERSTYGGSPGSAGRGTNPRAWRRGRSYWRTPHSAARAAAGRAGRVAACWCPSPCVRGKHSRVRLRTNGPSVLA